MWLVVLGFQRRSYRGPAVAIAGNANNFNDPRAGARSRCLESGAMTSRDDEFRLRPGRIRSSHGGQVKSFVGQVMQAAKKAGHTGRGFGQRRSTGGGSRFGRGRAASIGRTLRSPSRRVVIKARIVRHAGATFRSAPLARHIDYLEREGVTRGGARAHMFDAGSETADVEAFAERCEDDRHHFRFIVSPEDAGEMADLRAFTRELMADAERDLGTRLDWVAVDHWNTDNPHIHVLVRGRGDDGQDLVISRDYISRGLRSRAEERVTLELGIRSEREIDAALQKDVEAERWTGLDKALREIADDGGGVADLRPDATGPDPELRRLMVGRAMKLPDRAAGRSSRGSRRRCAICRSGATSSRPCTGR